MFIKVKQVIEQIPVKTIDTALNLDLVISFSPMGKDCVLVNISDESRMLIDYKFDEFLTLVNSIKIKVG